MSAAVSTSQHSDAGKSKKVLVSGVDASGGVAGGGPDGLHTPHNILVTPSDFPSTAEIMQKCLSVNPFELKFKEANRRLVSGAGSQAQQDLFEQNGLIPPKINIDSSSVSALLKLPSSISSPSIFSNIGLLSTDNGELKTSDFSKLVQQFSLQMKESGGLSTQPSVDASQAPRTADVLNAVLDMHSDRLHLFNCLNLQANTAQLLNSLTPAGSAPNSAGVLGLPVSNNGQAPSPAQTVAQALANAVASTSGSGGLVPPSVSVSSASPNGRSPQNNQGGISGFSQRSPNNNPLLSPQPDLASAVTAAVQSGALGLGGLPGNGLLANLSIGVDSASWDPRDVKPLVPSSQQSQLTPNNNASNPASAQRTTPQVTPRSDFYHNNDDMYGTPHTSNGYDLNPRSNESEVSSTGNGGGSVCSTSAGNSTTTGRGRGRGRAALVEVPSDERRMTILERNKAAAVRYRKRKKEEHDEMIGRVHILEQDKVQLATQNNVLRRELERVTALLKEREARCVCLQGTLPLSSDLRSDDMNGIDVLSSQNAAFLQHQNLMQAMSIKRPKM